MEYHIILNATNSELVGSVCPELGLSREGHSLDHARDQICHAVENRLNQLRATNSELPPELDELKLKAYLQDWVSQGVPREQLQIECIYV